MHHIKHIGKAARWQTRKKGLKCAALLLCCLTAAACTPTGITQEPASAAPQETSSQGAPAQGQEAAPVDMTMGIWGIESVVKAHEIACAGISEAIPEIAKMELTVYPTADDFYANMPSQIAAGTAPDLVKADYTYMYEYISKGYFVALEEQELDLSPFSKEAVDVFRIDDKLYGLPINAQPFCMIVNLDIWEQNGLGDIPKHWSDVEAAGKVLKEKGMPALIYDNEPAYITSLVQSFGGGWGRGKTVDSPENIEAFDFLINLIRNGYATTPQELGVADSSSAFTQGKSALILGGPWYNSVMASGAPDTKFALIKIPSKSDETRAYMPTIDGYFILKSAKNPALATKALNYVDRKEFQQAFYDGVGAMMSNLELREEYFKKYATAADLEDAMEYVQDPMFPENASEFAATVATELGSAIYTANSTLTGSDVLASIKGKVGVN